MKKLIPLFFVLFVSCWDGDDFVTNTPVDGFRCDDTVTKWSRDLRDYEPTMPDDHYIKFYR